MVGAKDAGDAFNPIWSAEPTDEEAEFEFADYSEGADRSVTDQVEEQVTPAPVTIIEETVIIVIEETEPVTATEVPENVADVYTEDDEEYYTEDDGEYTDYEDYGDEWDDDYGYETPSKSDLATIVAVAFWQVSMPMMVFNIV